MFAHYCLISYEMSKWTEVIKWTIALYMSKTHCTTSLVHPIECNLNKRQSHYLKDIRIYSPPLTLVAESMLLRHRIALTGYRRYTPPSTGEHEQVLPSFRPLLKAILLHWFNWANDCGYNDKDYFSDHKISLFNKYETKIFQKLKFQTAGARIRQQGTVINSESRIWV